VSKGDIVLLVAVNGVSVCKREDADQELRASFESNQIVSLYLLDGEALRQDMVKQAVGALNITIMPDTSPVAQEKDYAFCVGKNLKANVHFDTDSHEVFCPDPEIHLSAQK
jgi:hypothetical protein